MKIRTLTTCILLICIASPAQNNLDYWLESAEKPATQPAEQIGQVEHEIPPHALPGKIELSDGTVFSGWVYTTYFKPLSVFVETEKRWRRVPLAAAYEINAQIISEKTEAQWRWKAMGTPERVYTGKSYVSRRFQWSINIIDGTNINGTIKGQPIWILTDGQIKGPFILHERQRGKENQSAEKLIYLKKLAIGRFNSTFKKN